MCYFQPLWFGPTAIIDFIRSKLWTSKLNAKCCGRYVIQTSFWKSLNAYYDSRYFKNLNGIFRSSLTLPQRNDYDQVSLSAAERCILAAMVIRSA